MITLSTMKNMSQEKGQEQVGHHEHLRCIFSLTLMEDKITIAGNDFMFSVDSISQARGIPNHGENWFKDMNLDLEEYKP